MTETFDTPTGSPNVNFGTQVKAFQGQATPAPENGTAPAQCVNPTQAPIVAFAGQLRVFTPTA